jgi:DNA-binding protein YbaB
MFDQMKAMGAVTSLLKNRDKLEQAGREFRDKLDRIRVTGVAGGSAVRVTVTGQLEVTEVFIDPAVIAGVNAEEAVDAAAGTAEGRELAQTLVMDATNDAIARARAMIAEEARRAADELGLPDMPGMEKLLTGGA